MNSCISTEKLERYSLDFLDARDTTNVKSHVGACSACRRTLEALSGESSALASAAMDVAVPKVIRPVRRNYRLILGTLAAALLLSILIWPVANPRAFQTHKMPSPDDGQPATSLTSAESFGRARHQSSAPVDASSGMTYETYRYLNSLPPPGPIRMGPGAMVAPVMDAPDMIHKGYGVNGFIEAAATKLSTFGLDVDTASYTLARKYLTTGNLPPADAIRVEEFINFFKYGDPAPAKEAFDIHLEAAPSPFAKGRQLLRIAVRARDVLKKQRTPAILTFVIDISGSMGQDNRLGLVKQALHLLVEQLGEGDKVGIAVYDSSARVALEHTDDKAAILRVVDALRTGSATNAESGLRAGYTLADGGFRKGLLNRVILCSDGVANTGLTDPAAILKVIAEERARGIFLTTVGFGMGNYNDVIMEQLANKGNGSYHYVDEIKEARRIFVEGLVSTLMTVAIDAKIQVEFDPAVVKRYRLIGYENRAIANSDFRNNAIDAGEVGAGHTVTALYDIELQDEESPHRLAQAILRYAEPETKEHVEVTRSISRPQVHAEFHKASLRFQLAATVAQFAEILRNSEWAKNGTLEEVLGEASRLSTELDKPAEVVELVELVRKADQLKR